MGCSGPSWVTAEQRSEKRFLRDADAECYGMEYVPHSRGDDKTCPEDTKSSLGSPLIFGVGDGDIVFKQIRWLVRVRGGLDVDMN